MAVWKEHTMVIPKEYSELMEKMLHKVAKKFYGNEYAYHIDKNQRKIPDHLHWHARKV
tara:strand:- start:177 stop:350 length:174 start_codon:yes stop_codon:yes gene_type:complete